MSPGVLNCLGTVTDLLISFVFLIFHDFLCVDMLDRSSLHFFSIWFLADFFFGIQYLAFGFWHLLLAYSVKHFVSISSVIFWHLYSTHTFHQRLGSFPSLPEAVRVRIEWVSEWEIECHSSASKSPWHDYVIHELKMTIHVTLLFYFVLTC